MDEFRQCPVCFALVTGPHACAPTAIRRVVDMERLTEADVRRIVREELIALNLAGESER